MKIVDRIYSDMVLLYGQEVDKSLLNYQARGEGWKI